MTPTNEPDAIEDRLGLGKLEVAVPTLIGEAADQ